jgi:hypothetical protein
LQGEIVPVVVDVLSNLAQTPAASHSFFMVFIRQPLRFIVRHAAALLKPG